MEYLFTQNISPSITTEVMCFNLSEFTSYCVLALMLNHMTRVQLCLSEECHPKK